jgi:hypothetical protein
MVELSSAAPDERRSGAISVPTLINEYWTRTRTEPRSTIGRGTRATIAPLLLSRI